MIHKLKAADFEKIRPLARPWPFACAVDATLDGTCPGAVWVDEPSAPTAAVVDTPEGHYVIGDARNESFNHSMAEFIQATLAPGGRGENWWWFYLRCPSEEWVGAMRKALPEERTYEEPREFYVCRGVATDWRGRIPQEFELLRADAEVLACDDLASLDHLRRWAEGNFGSRERFLEKGFAFCMVHDGQLASFCCADNASGTRCEVGVHTAEGYRRQGLATLTVAAAVDWALSNGFEQVGWHCLRYNLASAATARRVGFRKASDYTAFMVCARAADAWAVKGNFCLIRHEFAAAAERYQKALDAVASTGDLASHLLGRREDRTRYASQAASVRALAGEQEADIEMLDAAIEQAGYRQGGY